MKCDDLMLEIFGEDNMKECLNTNSGNFEVLDYLEKIKKIVYEIKERGELLDSLISSTNDLRGSIKNVSDDLRNEIGNINEKIEDLKIYQIEQEKSIGEYIETNENIHFKTLKDLDDLKNMLEGYAEEKLGKYILLYQEMQKSYKYQRIYITAAATVVTFGLIGIALSLS